MKESPPPSERSVVSKEDSDLIASFARLNFEDKELVKDMIRRLAKQSSILLPPAAPAEIPAYVNPPARPKTPPITQVNKP